MSEFYDIAKAAEILGLKPADVQLLREQNKLRGFRDGASWKFKVDDVQNYLAESIKTKHATEDEDLVLGGSDLEIGAQSSDLELGSGSSDLELGAGSSDLQLGGSDLELGAGSSDLQMGAGSSDLELGAGSSDLELGAGSSDLEVGDGSSDLEVGDGSSDLELTETEFDVAGGSGINLGSEGKGPSGSDLELDLTLDQDVSLGESDIALASEEKAGDGSDVEVGADVLDDEDLVLGGSGAGSDVTIGGDSGISLVDPADSGLSLEEPLDLTGDDESLELGEDDMLTLEETDSEAAEVQTEDEFMLTPLEEVGDEESGSQVIALDMEDESAVAAAAPAMLDEDFGAAAPVGFEAVEEAPMDMASVSMAAAAAPVAAGAPALQEAPYSGLLVWLGLFPCTLFLALAGLMSYDIVRNMWNWDGAMTINSSILDMLKGMLF